MVENIKNKMIEIVNKDLQIKKIKMDKQEAIDFYEKERTLRGIAQIDNEKRESISLYYCEDYYNYFFGVMPISTGYISIFDVVQYRDGFLVRYPSTRNTNK